jgi:hypothetical protein
MTSGKEDKQNLQGGEIRPAAFSKGKPFFPRKERLPLCILSKKGLLAFWCPEL